MNKGIWVIFEENFKTSMVTVRKYSLQLERFVFLFGKYRYTYVIDPAHFDDIVQSGVADCTAMRLISKEHIHDEDAREDYALAFA